MNKKLYHGVPGGTRTPYLFLRREALYPGELLVHLFNTVIITVFFLFVNGLLDNQ